MCSHWMNRDYEASADAAEQLVAISYVELLDRASRIERPQPLRLAAAIHDAQTFAIWEPPTTGKRSQEPGSASR
jgi:hypothetical protein